jgi:hypothetical protein
VIWGTINQRSHQCKLILEEQEALRSILITIYDLANKSSLTLERVNHIISSADQVKFERAARMIRQLDPQPDTHDDQ